MAEKIEVVYREIGPGFYHKYLLYTKGGLGMNDMKDLRNALMRTGDGRSVSLWLLVFSVLLVRSIVSSGLALDQSKYLFFSLIVFLIFSSFRVSCFQPELKTNIWGLINVNAFGLFLIFMEFFK